MYQRRGQRMPQQCWFFFSENADLEPEGAFCSRMWAYIVIFCAFQECINARFSRPSVQILSVPIMGHNSSDYVTTCEKLLCTYTVLHFWSSVYFVLSRHTSQGGSMEVLSESSFIQTILYIRCHFSLARFSISYSYYNLLFLFTLKKENLKDFHVHCRIRISRIKALIYL
jgi:hypothetical protein